MGQKWAEPTLVMVMLTATNDGLDMFRLTNDGLERLMMVNGGLYTGPDWLTTIAGWTLDTLPFLDCERQPSGKHGERWTPRRWITAQWLGQGLMNQPAVEASVGHQLYCGTALWELICLKATVHHWPLLPMAFSMAIPGDVYPPVVTSTMNGS